MNLRPVTPALVAILTTVPALADAHAWEVSEIFSNADGSVQFVEWFNDEDDEHFMHNETVSTSSGGFFAFPRPLPHPVTAGRNFLMATAAFAAIPGAPTPDYIMPDGFLDPAGDTIDYSGGDVVSFGALPLDGKSSVTRNGAVLTNAPRNFANVSSSVRLAVSGARNGSGVNRNCYSATAPVLGATWNGTITAAGPTANIVAILGYETASSGLVLAGGELLVSVGSPQIFLLIAFSNTTSDVLSQTVPNDTALLEFSLSTQAVILGGGALEFCNAVDLILGH
ncbi:MAG: hypothetical protein CMJ89_08105 [Planctomycetes bacterium]|jgi:hypothetical protein|nr:hypothetical protein [Planctomycetota bacterium]